MNSVKVCLADRDSLREQVYRLRYDTYTTEIKSFDPEMFPDKMETDVYDQHSVHILALCEERVAGTLRLVQDSHHGFVMEPTFSIPGHIDRTLAVEHSRGIVVKEFRSRGIYLHMLEFAYEWQRKNNKPICLGAPNLDKLSGILEKAGWSSFGKPQAYHGITVVPMTHRL